jgi:toxin ParE1/3/4
MRSKFEVLITKRAENDVEEIWDYISRDSEVAADKFIAELLDQVIKLETNPKSFPKIEENEALGVDCYFHLVYKSYRTVYRVQKDAVYIVRVIHGSRLLSL